MMFCEDTKAIVHSPDGDTDYFEAGVLQGNKLVHFYSQSVKTINVNKTNDRKKFHIKKKKTGSKHYSVETITDGDCSDEQALFANTLAETESLPHSLEQMARHIDLNVNSDKTEFMCFNQDGAISSLNGSLWNK